MKTHLQIFEYWKDKAINKNGTIEDFKSDLIIDSIKVTGFWDKPMCWGCGKPIISKSEKQMLDLDKIWQDKEVANKLNRCHIKAKQFGGTDNVDNLFLMCEDCHIESPDTNNREAFFRWVYKKRGNTFMGNVSPELLFLLLNQEMLERNLPDIKTILATYPRMNFDDLGDFIQRNLGTHGGKASLSSEVIVFADYLEMKYKEMLETEK